MRIFNTLRLAVRLVCTKEFDMTAFARKMDTPVKGRCGVHGCGTAACIAGHASFLAGGMPQWEDDAHISFYAYYPIIGIEPIEKMASAWLGLEREVYAEQWLFYANWRDGTSRQRMTRVKNIEAACALVLLMLFRMDPYRPTKILNFFGCK